MALDRVIKNKNIKFMKSLNLKQMEQIEGGDFSWAGCVGGAATGFELAGTTTVVTGGWGLVAGLIGGCVLGGVGIL
jgi:hypothetical protein